MSYLVLARKYRPQTFADMIGQGHVVRTLTNAIRKDRVAHGFLFSGARGVGKTTSARLLAKALNCESGPTPEPCGSCVACKEITSGTSVDVQEIDGASNNGVDQVRELRENARYLPSRDRNKIYIIDEVHMLSGAAFNALLKTLEEPPSHVKFIFATTEAHKIPVTILSRTQRFDFRRIPLNQIVGRIETILHAEGISMSPAAQALVARQAEGSMRDALSLLDQVIGAGGDSIDDSFVEEILGVIDRTEVVALAGALIERDGGTALEIVARVFDRGLDLARLAEDLAWHVRNLMVVQVGGKAEPVLDVADHELAGLEEQASRVDPATLSFFFDVVHAAVPEIGRAVQPRLALEVALLKAIHMAPGVDLSSLVERVEAMAGGLSGGGGGGGGGAAARQPSSVRPSRAAPSAPPSRRAAPEYGQDEPPEPPEAPPTGVFGQYAARLAARAEEQSRLARSEPGEKRDDLGWGGGSAEQNDGGTASRLRKSGPPAEPTSVGSSAVEAAPMERPALERDWEPPREPHPAVEPEDAKERRPAAKPKGSRDASPIDAAPAAESAAPAPEEAGEVGAKPAEDKLPKADDPALPVGERFAKLVEAIGGIPRRSFIAAALEHARPISIDGSEMVLALNRGFYQDLLQGSSNRRKLETLMEDHFGASLHLRIEAVDESELGDVPEAIASVKERALAEEAAAIRGEALANPAVRRAVEALDGEIEDIRILDERFQDSN